MNIRYGVLILTFLSSCVFGQLKLSITLRESIAEVSIFNDSKESYVLPVDKINFRPYEKDCGTFSDHESEFPSFGLMINIATKSDKKEDYTIGYKNFDDIGPIKKDVDIKRQNFKNKIEKWAKKNNIKDYNTASINYNLINNLIYLEPHEKISFKIKVDLYNITNQELMYYNYILRKTENYNFYLSLCEYNDFDKYLTSSQKEKLKKYKFFKGSLESNKIELKQ